MFNDIFYCILWRIYDEIVTINHKLLKIPKNYVTKKYSHKWLLDIVTIEYIKYIGSSSNKEISVITKRVIIKCDCKECLLYRRTDEGMKDQWVSKTSIIIGLEMNESLGWIWDGIKKIASPSSTWWWCYEVM